MATTNTKTNDIDQLESYVKKAIESKMVFSMRSETGLAKPSFGISYTYDADAKITLDNPVPAVIRSFKLEKHQTYVMDAHDPMAFTSKTYQELVLFVRPHGYHQDYEMQFHRESQTFQCGFTTHPLSPKPVTHTSWILAVSDILNFNT